jgi:hypothetical protein
MGAAATPTAAARAPRGHPDGIVFLFRKRRLPEERFPAPGVEEGRARRAQRQAAQEAHKIHPDSYIS